MNNSSLHRDIFALQQLYAVTELYEESKEIVTYDKVVEIPSGYDEPYDTLDEEKEEDEDQQT